MPLTILVDESDAAPCNLRCLKAGGAPYCARYGHCLASSAHRLQALVDPRRRERVIVREANARSHQGGHIRTRRRVDALTQAVVEDIELSCRTLKFESLASSERIGRIER
jgi:hypothetical protein